jgi:hypothetical protein
MITDPESWRIAWQDTLCEENATNFQYLQLRLLIDAAAEIAALRISTESIDANLTAEIAALRISTESIAQSVRAIANKTVESSQY